MKSSIKIFISPITYRTNNMCKRVNSKEPIMLKYYPDRCNMCDKAVNTCLPKLKYVLD